MRGSNVINANGSSKETSSLHASSVTPYSFHSHSPRKLLLIPSLILYILLNPLYSLFNALQSHSLSNAFPHSLSPHIPSK